MHVLCPLVLTSPGWSCSRGRGMCNLLDWQFVRSHWSRCAKCCGAFRQYQACQVTGAPQAHTYTATHSSTKLLTHRVPVQVVDALELSRAALGKIRQNLAWALVYNLAAIPLAAGALLPSMGLAISPSVAGNGGPSWPVPSATWSGVLHCGVSCCCLPACQLRHPCHDVPWKHPPQPGACSQGA